MPEGRTGIAVGMTSGMGFGFSGVAIAAPGFSMSKAQPLSSTAQNFQPALTARPNSSSYHATQALPPSITAHTGLAIASISSKAPPPMPPVPPPVSAAAGKSNRSNVHAIIILY